MERQETVRLLSGLSRQQARLAAVRPVSEQPTIAVPPTADGVRGTAAGPMPDVSATATGPRPAGPPPVLSVPFDYFLVSHDRAGRPLIQQANLEPGIAAAVLIELLRVGWAAVEHGRLVTADDPPGGGDIASMALRSVAAEPGSSVASWIRGARTELFLHVTQQVVDAGVLVPVKRVMSGVLYQRVNEAVANEPGVRVVRHLLNAHNPPDERTYLLIALINTTQLHGTLPLDLKSRQKRDLVRSPIIGRPPAGRGRPSAPPAPRGRRGRDTGPVTSAVFEHPCAGISVGTATGRGLDATFGLP